MGAETHDLGSRRPRESDRDAAAIQELEDPDRLEEVETEAFLEEPPLQSGGMRRAGAMRGAGRPWRIAWLQVVDHRRSLLTQTSACSPVRGGQARSGVALCLVVATNWVNELIDVYSARKRSSTHAN